MIFHKLLTVQLTNGEMPPRRRRPPPPHHYNDEDKLAKRNELENKLV